MVRIPNDNLEPVEISISGYSSFILCRKNFSDLSPMYPQPPVFSSHFHPDLNFPPSESLQLGQIELRMKESFLPHFGQSFRGSMNAPLSSFISEGDGR